MFWVLRALRVVRVLRILRVLWVLRVLGGLGVLRGLGFRVSFLGFRFRFVELRWV